MEEQSVETTQVTEKSKATLFRYDASPTIEDVMNFAFLNFSDYANSLEEVNLVKEENERIFRLTLTIEEI